MLNFMNLYFGEASIFLNVLVCVLSQKDIFVIAISLVGGQKYFLTHQKYLLFPFWRSVAIDLCPSN